LQRLLLLAALACPGCALLGPDWQEAAPATIASSFAPFRERLIAGEDAETFMRRRTATLLGGVETLHVTAEGGRISSSTVYETDDPVSLSTLTRTGVQGAAAAVSADGYYLTAAYDLSLGPAHLVIEAGGEVRSAPARVVWTDEDFDVALLHADLAPEDFFALVPDRELAEGEVVLSFSHMLGAAAGQLSTDVDLPEEGEYVALTLPHSTPLRRGFSGAPAITLDGELLGVDTSTGWETIFTRRSWMSRVRPARLRELMEKDRHGR